MRLAMVLVLGLLCVGFVYPPQDQLGSEGSPRSFVAPEDKALVVFVRPAKLGKPVKFYVLDGNKKLLTFLKGNEHVTIEVAPGRHTFYVVSENVSLVRAQLAARHTYVVRAEAKMGLAKARVAAHPVFRNTSDFAESAKWIRETKRGEPDFAKGNKWVKKHEDRINMEIKAAEVDWLKMDEKARGSMTMRPEDGRTADEAGKL